MCSGPIEDGPASKEDEGHGPVGAAGPGSKIEKGSLCWGKPAPDGVFGGQVGEVGPWFEETLEDGETSGSGELSVGLGGSGGLGSGIVGRVASEKASGRSLANSGSGNAIIGPW